MAENKLTKQDIKKVYVRNLFALQFGWNYEKMQGLGYTYVIMPALKRLYGNDPEKMKRAMKMHLSYFNTTPAMAHLITGADIALEEELGIESEETVMAVKTGLMGPLAGIGDSLLFSVVRVIAAGIGISFALQGSILGPILFFLIYNGCTMALRYSLGYIGFISGSSFITKMYEDGTLKVLTKCAGILGLIMVGAMTASTVKFTTAINIAIPGAEAVSLQSSLDTLFLGIVPLLLTFGCKKLLDKNVNINWIMIGILVLSMVMAVLHIV